MFEKDEALAKGTVQALFERLRTLQQTRRAGYAALGAAEEAARAAASGATWRSQIPRAVVLGTSAFSFFMRLASRLGSPGSLGRV